MNPLRFNPEGTFEETKDGQLISVFQPAFIVIAAVAYRALGAWAFAVLPLLVRVHERDSKSVGHTVRVLGSLALWRLNAGKDMILDTLGLRQRDE